MSQYLKPNYSTLTFTLSNHCGGFPLYNEMTLHDNCYNHQLLCTSHIIFCKYPPELYLSTALVATQVGSLSSHPALYLSYLISQRQLFHSPLNCSNSHTHAFKSSRILTIHSMKSKQLLNSYQQCK